MIFQELTAFLTLFAVNLLRICVGGLRFPAMFSGVKSPMRMPGRLTGAYAFLVLLGCVEPTQSISADAPRRSTPVPACIFRLAQRGESQKAFLRQIAEKQVWKAVFPAFDEEHSTLETGALVCTGENIFHDPAFADAQPRGGWPLHVQDGDVRYGSGPSRLKIVWLRTHQAENGVDSGVVALMRTLEDYVEIYSVGAYRGDTEKTRFASERLGSELFVTAEYDGCRGVKPNEPCETLLHIFALDKGRLNQRAAIGLERVQIVKNGELGAQGDVRYRLVTTPKFAPDGIHLLEQVTATDESGRRLRQVELERVLRTAGGEMVPSAPSLWERVAVDRASSSRKEQSDGTPQLETGTLKNPTHSDQSPPKPLTTKSPEQPKKNLARSKSAAP